MRMLNRRALIASLYFILSLAILIAWTGIAKTESPRYYGKGHYTWWNGVSQMIDGEVPSPFVKRRLLPDSAKLISVAIPKSAWTTLTRWVDGPSFAGRKLRAVLDRLKWKRERYPELFCAYGLIWISICGFMHTARRFALTQYKMPVGASVAVGAVLGIGLIGGCDPGWYSYPYDLPNAFVFLLTLLGMVSKRWWFPLAFIAAVYSKESSLLLIFAYAALNWDDLRRPRHLATLALLCAIYLPVQLGISHRFPPRPGGPVFWFPDRNAKLIARLAIYHSWANLIFLVVVLRMVRFRRQIPRDLRRLLWLVPVILGLAFFKGWFEERRQYLEIYPILGLIVLQWAALELGVGELFSRRERHDGPEDERREWLRTHRSDEGTGTRRVRRRGKSLTIH